MSSQQYGKDLIHSLIRLSGQQDEKMLDYLIAIIEEHNLVPELVSLKNIREVLEQELQKMSPEEKKIKESLNSPLFETKP